MGRIQRIGVWDLCYLSGEARLAPDTTFCARALPLRDELEYQNYPLEGGLVQ